MRILGIDPALGTTGWGVIEKQGNTFQYVVGGIIKTNPKDNDPERLKEIYEGLDEIIDTYKPTHVAVEEVFVNSNARTSLKLGQARAMGLLVPAQKNLPVAEYTPLHIKKAVVGYGRATKDQVQHMVKVLLPTAAYVTHDTADALAVALCHGHTMGSLLQNVG